MKHTPYLPSYLRLAIITLAGLTTATWLQATPIYTWEDDQGTTHFSDQPRSGATIVELNTLQPIKPEPHKRLPTTPSSNTPPYNTETTEFQDTQTTQAAATIRLLSPLDQQTLRDNEGMISVSVATNQKLGKDHSTQLLLDGTQYGQPQTQLNWRLSNIDRGSHTLQAQILNNGKVIASSEVITVYLHRASLLQRQPPAIKPK